MSLHHVQEHYPDLYRLLVTWRDDLIAVLGENLVAVYVMGSLLMGDFVEVSSDVDVLVVTARTPTHGEVTQLARLHPPRRQNAVGSAAGRGVRRAGRIAPLGYRRHNRGD